MIFLRQYAHNAFFPHRPGYDLLPLLGAIVGPAIAILWPKPSRSRTIFDWLYRREALAPPTMVDRGKKNS
jgi:hypothetical protein